jgi:mono/diheme cytochrome c family protein
MRARFACFRAIGRNGLANIGFVVVGVSVFGMAVLGAVRAVAQKEDAGARKNKSSTYAVLAEVPEKARERRNPFEADTQAVVAGGKLFEQHCADCHGRKAGGARKGPSLLREEVQQATPGTLFWILTNGVVRRGMPVWSKLPEPERWQIVTFLQSLKLQSVDSQPEEPGEIPAVSTPLPPLGLLE